MTQRQNIEIPEPALSRFLFADTRVAAVWLVIRLYVGYEWFMAGWNKVHSPAWAGSNAGEALTGFLNSALAKAHGAHPDVLGWYGSFLSGFALHHTMFLSYLVACGEVLVGAALILGIFTGIAAFFGAFMNFNYLLSGSLSINAPLALLSLLLILAWRTAGWLGLDRWVLPLLGTPWQAGRIFRK
jgi:thiosulfate dehydrogenase [quinone] large subunit